jgi:hypothetical protein
MNSIYNDYRSFIDCDELIETFRKVWKTVYRNSNYPYYSDMEMPTIWVRNKLTGIREMIIGYGITSVVLPTAKPIMLELLEDYTFLDGSPCGVLKE